MHAISAVKGFVHDGGDEFGGSPDGGDADEGWKRDSRGTWGVEKETKREKGKDSDRN